MNISLQKLWSWARNKYGRIVTAAGFALSGVETFDITPIKDPLEGLIGHRWVQAIVVALFGLSWLRHQQVAKRVSKLQEAVAPVPVPPKDVPEK